MFFKSVTFLVASLSFFSIQVNAQAIPFSQIVNSTSGEYGNKNVEIRPGEEAVIDTSVDIGELVINGKLSCSNATSLAEIKARTIYVNGIFECGSEALKFNKKLIISLKHSFNIDPKTNSTYRGVVVNKDGVLRLNAVSERAGFVRLNRTVNPGENSIVVDKGVDWKVGDDIVLAPTSYDPNEAETFKITGINGTTIYLSSSVQFLHWGEKEILNTRKGQVVLDHAGEVSNLTRNILIRADETAGAISNADAPGAQLGGHVMVHRGGKAFVDGVEFYKMGQAGVMARYPFHWHLVGDGSGQYIKNSSIHKSFQRCVTVHGTNNTLVENNVCYDFKGHGFFFELGNEINNTMTRNLAIQSRFPSSTKFLLASDNPVNSVQSRFPAVSNFWIVNPQNTINYNISAGSVGSGFWMAYSSEVRKFNSATGEFDGELLARPVITNTTDFSNNIAHSSKVGMTWDGAPVFSADRKNFKANNPNNVEDRLLEAAHYAPSVVPVFKNLINYKNNDAGIYFRGNTAVFDGGIMADNGWSFFLAFNQIVKNFTVVGKTKNNGIPEKKYNETMRQVGAVFYDGPMEMENVDFINFPQTKVTGYVDNVAADVTATPFMPIPGAAKYTNTIKNVSFSPEPYYRMYAQKYDPSQMQAWTEDNNSNATRDLDGSFTGVPGGLVLSSSSYTSHPGCEEKSFDGKPSFFRLKVCPPKTRTVVLWMNQDEGEGKTPYVMRKNGKEISIPMNEWKVLDRIKNPNEIIFHVKNRLVSSENDNYEILLRDRFTGPGHKNIGVILNSEYQNEISPIFKLTGFGSGCSLNGGTGVGSYDELKNSGISSFYSKGNDFYFRVFSQYPMDIIKPSVHGSVVEEYSGYHQIRCADKISHEVVGNIDAVKTDSLGTTISGWACDYAKSEQIDLHLYVGGGASGVKETMIGAVRANESSEANVAFACADPSMVGHRFTYKVASDAVALHRGKKINFYGISTSGKANNPITGSGDFSIGGNGPDVVTPPTPPTPTVTNGSFCSGKNEVLWKCGVTASPGTGWGHAGGGCYHKDNGPAVSCGATPPPPPPPATVETNGSFCSGKNEVLWKCGVTTSPGAGWGHAGGGCYHKDNGPAVSCGAPPPPPPSNVTNGFFCSGRNEILWTCGVATSPGSKWVNVGGGCYHKDNGSSSKCSP